MTNGVLCCMSGWSVFLIWNETNRYIVQSKTEMGFQGERWLTRLLLLLLLLCNTRCCCPSSTPTLVTIGIKDCARQSIRLFYTNPTLRLHHLFVPERKLPVKCINKSIHGPRESFNLDHPHHDHHHFPKVCRRNNFFVPPPHLICFANKDFNIKTSPAASIPFPSVCQTFSPPPLGCLPCCSSMCMVSLLPA